MPPPTKCLVLFSQKGIVGRLKNRLGVPNMPATVLARLFIPEAFGRRRLAGFVGRRAAENRCILRHGNVSPVGRVPHGIGRVSIVWLVTDVDPLEAIPAPAGAVVASCCGER